MSDLEEIIDKIIELKPRDDKTIIEIEFKKHKDEADKIRSGLNELKIMKINTEKELEKTGCSKLLAYMSSVLSKFFLNQTGPKHFYV